MTRAQAPGFILVHGGEHGPWCWEKVIPRLEWQAVAVALPGRDARAGDQIRFGIDDSARELSDAVERTAFRPCIVACHSLGGLAVLAAEPRYTAPPDHHVFISALTPRPGSAGLEALPLVFRAYLRLRLGSAKRRGKAIHLIPRWLAGAIWFHDLGEHDRAVAAQALCAESPLIPMERTPGEFRRGENATYIVLDHDRAMRPGTQAKMARNIGIHDVRSIEASHEVMLSRPGLLADELNRIAREVQSRQGNHR